MTQFDATVASRPARPDVYSGLLCVATMLLGMGVAWMVLTNTEHSALDDRSEGGPLVLVAPR